MTARGIVLLALFAGLAGVTGCRSARIDPAEALAAQSVEMQLDARGRASEIEYHIAPGEVPEAVRAAMDRLHPGGRYVGAEREWNGGKLYYELTREVRGMEVEAMFTPEGELFSEEIAVPAARVPAAVREAAARAVPGGRVRKYEEIRDGSRELVEYHVKMAKGKARHKVMLSPEGRHIATYREIPAEIEVRQ